MKGTGWIRFFAVLDLLVTAPLAMPGLTRPWTHMLLSAAGQLPVPDPWLLPAPSTVLFAQLLGVLGLCWNGARLAWPYDRRLVGIDMVARLLVALLLVIQLVSAAPPALGLFVVTELLGAAVAFTRSEEHTSEL